MREIYVNLSLVFYRLHSQLVSSVLQIWWKNMHSLWENEKGEGEKSKKITKNSAVKAKAHRARTSLATILTSTSHGGASKLRKTTRDRVSAQGRPTIVVDIAGAVFSRRQFSRDSRRNAREPDGMRIWGATLHHSDVPANISSRVFVSTRLAKMPDMTEEENFCKKMAKATRGRHAISDALVNAKLAFGKEHEDTRRTLKYRRYWDIHLNALLLARSTACY